MDGCKDFTQNTTEIARRFGRTMIGSESWTIPLQGGGAKGGPEDSSGAKFEELLLTYRPYL